MAIPQIQSYDYFHDWRTKVNRIATLMGDLELVNVLAADRDTFVEALNKVISNIGILTNLTTTDKTSIVNAIDEHQTKIGSSSLTTTSQVITGAINELDGEQGVLTSLTTSNKATLVAAINELDSEHGVLTSLTTSNKATLVAAINEAIDHIGALATLNTTAKDNLVDAISEVQTELGDITTLSTTSKTSAVSAINEVLGDLFIGNATFTIGTEASNIIRVSVQLKNRFGSNLTSSAGVKIYLSDLSTGLNLTSTAPSGGWATGTQGVLIPIVSGKVGTAISNGTGLFDIDITEAAAKTFYLVVILPLGNLKISSAITFT